MYTTSHLTIAQCVLEQILAASNSIETIMQVPHMANNILSCVTVQNIVVEELFLELRDINVFKVQSAEAQIQNTGIMLNPWWENGQSLPEWYVLRLIAEMVGEAKQFCPTVEVSQSAECYVCTHGIKGWHGPPSPTFQHASNADAVNLANVHPLQPDHGGNESGNRGKPWSHAILSRPVSPI